MSSHHINLNHKRGEGGRERGREGEEEGGRGGWGKEGGEEARFTR